jgi:hypothetical protein
MMLAQFASVVLGVMTVLAAPALGQVFDDFSDLEDTSNPQWSHLNVWLASTGQTWDASTGQYRMTAPNNGASGFGFVGSYVQPMFTNTTVAADIVSFVDGPSQGAVFGVAARLNGINVVGGLTGYTLAYEPFAVGGEGELVLNRINPGASLTQLGGLPVTLDPARDYTFVLDIQGSLMHGQVFEIGGGLVGEVFANDATYPSGFSGLIGYSQTPLPPVDVTWDNYRANVPAPATCTLAVAFASLARRTRRRAA